MKKTQYASIIALALGCAATSQAALVTGLVAYYDFEETGTAGLANKAPGATDYNGSWSGSFDAPDLDGPGFTGDATYNPGDGLSDRSTLLVGNALNVVDGNNTFADMDIGTADIGKTMTVSLWTYLAPSAGNTSARFPAFGTGDTGVYDLSIGTKSNYNATGRNDYTIYGPDNDKIGTDVLNSYSEETWHHHVITATVSGADMINSYYLDGVLTRSETSVGAAANFSFTGLHFGDARDGATNDRDWDGLIDEVAIYNRAITATEADELYDRGIAGLAVVPEPSSSALLGLGLSSMLLRRKRS